LKLAHVTHHGFGRRGQDSALGLREDFPLEVFFYEIRDQAADREATCRSHLDELVSNRRINFDRNRNHLGIVGLGTHLVCLDWDGIKNLGNSNARLRSRHEVGVRGDFG
jgi:hypothetical protein